MQPERGARTGEPLVGVCPADGTHYYIVQR